MIVKRFEEIVVRYGDKIAIKAGDTSLTYHGLNSLVNRTARMILHLYPGIDLPSHQHTVALLLEPGTEAAAAVLATLKAGKIYVPFDPDFPVKRLQYMRQHYDIRLLVTDTRHMELAETLRANASEKIAILNIQQPHPNLSPGNLELETGPDQPAYILQTSGSDGYPKGVVQARANLVFFTDRYIDALQITPGDRVSFLSAFHHDGAIQDIYGALLSGAALYPFDLKRSGAAEIADWLIKEKITLYHSIPTVFRYFVATITGETRFPGLRLICMGGEPLRQHDLKIIREHFPGTLLAHMYGQTESSVNTMEYIDVRDADPVVTLGAPLEGIELLVLNEQGEEVEELETGEIVVVSRHIATGYWKDPETTASAFLYDEELGPMYRSGDLGKIDYDGSIRFIGRKDQQVKIRGFRVELAEIESRLLQHHDIKEAVVTIGEDKSADNYLCAYIVTNSAAVGYGENPGELRRYLTGFLPDYMIPSYFVLLEKLPLTATGKINHRALPIPGTLTSRAEAYTPPRDTIEETLVNLWSEVLGIEKHLIGVTDNFFELGGHSLKATVLASKIHKELHVKIPLAEILNTPFIREIASKIREAGQTRFMEIETVEEKEYYQLSYNQKRLWIIYCMDPDRSSYHMPGWFQLNHAVNIETLKKALSRVFKRHESFRTAFKEVCNQPVQFIRQGVQLPFTVIDLTPLADDQKQQKTAELMEQTITPPFDLQNPPLFRSMLIKQENEAFVLVYCMHHIISDGWSNYILQREFNLCYESYLSGQEPRLAPLQFHYRDFSAWHNRRIHDLQLKEKSHRYWSGKLGPGFPTLNLPNYYSRDMTEKSGAGFRCTVNQDIKNRLHLLAREHNTTLFTVLFSMFNLLLFYLSGQQEVALCIISAGREHLSLNNIVGYFTTPIIVKNRVDLDEDFDDLLSRVNREVLEAFKHQSYPLELAADEMGIAYPDIPAAFNLINMQDISLGIEMDSLSSGHTQVQRDVKFDIVLYITEYKNGIEIQWHYQKSLFKPEIIESIAGKYLKLMDEITGNQ